MLVDFENTVWYTIFTTVTLESRYAGQTRGMKHTVLAAALLTSSLALHSLTLVDAQSTPYRLERRAVQVGSRSVPVTLIRASLERVRLGVAIAGGRVGGNALLSDIGKQARAICAVNGTFLAAYQGQTGEPYGTLNVEGRWLHLGSTGTRLDILADGGFRFVPDNLRVLGGLDDSSTHPNNWYAYGINRTPQNRNSSYVFTPERGPRLGFRAEFAAVVQNDTITRTAQGEDVLIPRDGYVIALSGAEVSQLGNRFRVGRTVQYRVVSKTDQPSDNVQYSLGAGPKLVTNGAISLDPVAEGFTSSKILNERGGRSAIGFTRTEVIFAVIANATIAEEATVMRSLGALEAMNLDGGASSGLWCGSTIVAPGRQIANAVVLWTR